MWDSEGISEKKDTVVEDLFEACECDTDHESRGKSQRSEKRDPRVGLMMTQGLQKRSRTVMRLDNRLVLVLSLSLI